MVKQVMVVHIGGGGGRCGQCGGGSGGEWR